MVQYGAENSGLGIDEMIAKLMSAIWDATSLKGLPGLIQQQNQQLLLTYLLAVSVSDEASFATKAQMLNAIEVIKKRTTEKLKTITDTNNKGYLLLTLERIKAPEKAKPTLHEAPPPGSPIGCDADQ